MSCDILNAYEWALPNEQYFVSVGFGRDVVVLYQDKGAGPQKYRSIDLSDNAVCIDYSPTEPGLVVVGSSEGSLITTNFYQPTYSASKRQAKYSRPVNSVSLNSSGLAAMGLDRARGEESLLIWDLQAEKNVPILSMLSNEAVSCLKFIPSRPTQLLAATYKAIREIDTRTNGTDSLLIPTKYSYYIKAHQSDENLFLSYSESGNMALWDRRKLAPTGASTAPEPLIILPRVFSEGRGKLPRCVQINPNVRGEFGVLNDGEVIRRWQCSIITQETAPVPVSALSTAVGGASSGEKGPQDAVFIDRVIDVRLEHDKVVAFDYAPNADGSSDIVCVRQSGLVFRTPCKDPLRSLNFLPNNDLVCSDSRQISSIGPQRALRPKIQPTRLDSHDLLEHFTQHGLEEDAAPSQDGDDDDNESESGAHADHLPLSDVINNDINSIIGQRAELGYGANTEQNIQVLHECPGAQCSDLIQAWKWLSFSHKQDQEGSSHTPQLDLAFAGVWAIWEGFSGFQNQRRYEKDLSRKEYDAQVRRIVEKYSETIYVGDVKSNKPGHRQLCLRAAGWNFEIDELEEKLKDLEAKGQHEKAAGWAVFHGRVERAIQSLAASRKPQLRLMSTAVAGYQAYKDVPHNNAWREQCRRLASEMSVPYLRAIFAYISDGSWFDVLDEGSLPVVERLGIALRFLPDNELDRYLERITTRAIQEGDLEGIIMIGQTPLLVDLLQSFVNKTADVQTASVIAMFGCTRFFSDPRVDNWVAAYRTLLNQRKMFTTRAIFDVSRNKLSKSRFKALNQTPIPRQVFMRCLNCQEILGSRSTKNIDAIRSKSRCTNCNYPLPKCAVCLLTLGPFSREEPPILDRWPTFCMTCSHGSHTQHAREWFDKHTVCPVPECKCECGRS